MKTLFRFAFIFMLCAVMIGGARSVSLAQGQSTAFGDIHKADSGCTVGGGGCISLQLPANSGSAAVQISGTATSLTMTFEASVDGVNFAAVKGVPIATNLDNTTGSTTATAVGIWQFKVCAFRWIRARCSTYSSGTIYVTVSSSTASF